MDIRVEAIRKDPCVGSGTGASADECLGTDDLISLLDGYGITSEKDAVQWARDYEQMFMEQLLNARWGEDSDPELKEYATWKKKLEDNPL